VLRCLGVTIGALLFTSNAQACNAHATHRPAMLIRLQACNAHAYMLRCMRACVRYRAVEVSCMLVFVAWFHAMQETRVWPAASCMPGNCAPRSLHVKVHVVAISLAGRTVNVRLGWLHQAPTEQELAASPAPWNLGGLLLEEQDCRVPHSRHAPPIYRR
jgi:hypothetical protein